MAWPEDVNMPFGKHRGEALGQILADDPRYFDFLADLEITSDRLREAIDAMRKKYAAEIDKAIDD